MMWLTLPTYLVGFTHLGDRYGLCETLVNLPHLILIYFTLVFNYFSFSRFRYSFLGMYIRF